MALYENTLYIDKRKCPLYPVNDRKMSLIIPISKQFDFLVPAQIDDVYELLADVPRSVSHFPKVDRVVKLGENDYRWEMEKMGIQKMSLQIQYTSHYTFNPREKWIRWSPVKGGNAEMGGLWRLTAKEKGTHIHFENDGKLIFPVPRMARMVVKPIATQRFLAMLDVYIDNLKQTFSTL